MFCIQKVINTNIPTLAEVASEIWYEYYTPIIGLQQVEYMVEKFQSVEVITQQIDNGYEYYFAIYNGEIAGYFGAQPQNNNLFLSKLYIKKAFRGKGISTQIFAYIKDIALKYGKSKITLTINRYNYDTIDIYKHFGFKVEREEKADIGNGFYMDDYIMTLII